MRILFEPLAGALGLGPVMRCMAIAEAAVMRGHTIAVLAPPQYPLVDQFELGLRFVGPTPVRPRDLTPQETAGESSGYPHALKMRGLADASYLRQAIESELSVYSLFKPDVVVTEMQPTLAVSCTVRSIPFAVTAATPYLDSHAADAGRVDAEPAQSLFREIAADYGLIRRDLEDLVHGGAAMNICPTTPTLEPELAKLPNAEYVGALLSPSLELSSAPRIDGKRRVLVYLGTGIVSVEALLPGLLAAFPEDEYGVLVASRHRLVAGRQTPFKVSNVTVAFQPGIIRALQNTDIFINRCGQNAMAASLLAGVPIIGVPGTSSEPLFNLSVLERHSAAVSIGGVPSAAELRNATDRLNGIGADHHARTLGDELRRYLGAQGAVMALERKFG